MPYKNTPSFWFSRSGTTIFASFNNHPLKDSEGKEQNIHFKMTCSSDLEAHLLNQYLQDMQYEMRKIHFTEGFNAHKKREKNWYL